MTIAVQFKNISKTYSKSIVLRNVDFAVEMGDFAVVYGLPASGKSVLMRLLMGLEKPTQGEIWLRGRDMSHIGPGERNIGYVPQSFALYPHLSVYDNIAYPLKMTKAPAQETDASVKEIARLLKIERLLDKKPDQISGGQKQRVAIARGLVKRTDIYVLDDPLAGLDFKLREQLIDDLKQLQREFGMTFLYTTSDPIESLSLAKHIAILDGGSIVEFGEPETLYAEPRHLRTMELLGFPNANALSASCYAQAGETWCDAGLFQFPLRFDHKAEAGAIGESVTVCFRPEHLHILDNRTGEDAITIPCSLALREDLGGEEIVYLETNGQGGANGIGSEGGILLTTVVRHEGYEMVADVKQASLDPAQLFVFSSRTGKRIGKGGALACQP